MIEAVYEASRRFIYEGVEYAARPHHKVGPRRTLYRMITGKEIAYSKTVNWAALDRPPPGVGFSTVTSPQPSIARNKD